MSVFENLTFVKVLTNNFYCIKPIGHKKYNDRVGELSLSYPHRKFDLWNFLFCDRLWSRWRRSTVFIVSFEQILRIVLVLVLLILKKYMPAGLRRNTLIISV